MKQPSGKGPAILGTVAVLVILGGMAAGSGVQAEWKNGTTIIEANGTVISLSDAQMPKSAKGTDSYYLKVVFKTPDGTYFVIPFRRDDMEAIPRATFSFTCEKSASMCSYNPSVSDSNSMSGTLRYHNCDGYLYCFDSFTESKSTERKDN